MFDELVMEQMAKFKDKVPFSIENDIMDDDMNVKNVEEKLKDDEISTSEQEALIEWAKEVNFLIFSTDKK